MPMSLFFFVLKIFKFNHLCFVCCVCICFVHLHHHLLDENENKMSNIEHFVILSLSSVLFHFISFRSMMSTPNTQAFQKWTNSFGFAKFEGHQTWLQVDDFFFFLSVSSFLFSNVFFEMKIETKRLHYTNIWYVTDYWLIDWLIDWSYFLFWLTFVLGLFRFFWI